MAGLRPGLLQKYQNAVTADEKFALLKAFMLDPLSMADVTIEASYVELSKEEDKAKPCSPPRLYWGGHRNALVLGVPRRVGGE